LRRLQSREWIRERAFPPLWERIHRRLLTSTPRELTHLGRSAELASYMVVVQTQTPDDRL
jgi:hypothetical protein